MTAAYKRKAGEVMSAELLEFLPYQRKKRSRHSPAQKAGLRYETLTFGHLTIELPSLNMHPVLRFRSAGRSLTEIAIPDALAFSTNGAVITIIEIKLRHTHEAWNQLHNLYLPIAQNLFKGRHINLVEICQNFDPGTVLPGPSEIIEELSPWIEVPQQRYGVYLWSGR